jgi:hypothetical protein
MPGTYMVETGRTFSAMILMSSGPRLKFGSNAEQEVSATGEKKWVTEVAVTHYPAAPGMRPVSEVIAIVITGPASDPGAAIQQGSAVEFPDLRMGIMTPEQGERGIRGGRPYFMASGIRAANGRPSPAAKGE